MLKDEKEKEKEAFKNMKFKEKLRHVVMYYRYHILIGVIILAILAWALNHFVINPPKKSSLTFLFHSTVLDAEKATEIQTALSEKFPELYTNKKEIQVRAVGTASGNDPEYGYALTMQVVVMVSAKEVDLVIADKETGLDDAAAEYLAPLDEIFTEEELAELQELANQHVRDEENGAGILETELVTTDSETGQEIHSGPYPYLINISNNEAIQEVFYGKEIYVGVIANTTKLDAAKDMIWKLVSASN